MNINTILENEIKTLVKNKIEEKMGQQALNLAKKLALGPIERVLDIIAARIVKYSIPQKIEFGIHMLEKIGIPPEEVAKSAQRFKATAAEKAGAAGADPAAGAGADPAAAAVAKALQK